MAVSTEIKQGVKNPTRKAAWSLVGVIVVSATTSIVAPMAFNFIKSKMTKKGGK